MAEPGRTATRAAAGRPREFDVDDALDRAVEVFWRQGYEATSLTDLTTAMGINKPSLYAAFGNKEKLFRAALERYTEGPGSYAARAVEEPTARGVAEAFLRGTVEATTRPRSPHGCLGSRAPSPPATTAGRSTTCSAPGGTGHARASSSASAGRSTRATWTRASTRPGWPAT